MNAMTALQGPQESRALFGKTWTTRGAVAVVMADIFPACRRQLNGNPPRLNSKNKKGRDGSRP